MEIKNEIIILRDFIKQDIEDRIYWETVETEWQLWDAPWEYDEGEEIFNPEKYREEKLAWIEKDKDNSRIRSVFQICINNKKNLILGGAVGIILMIVMNTQENRGNVQLESIYHHFPRDTKAMLHLHGFSLYNI